MLDYEKNEQVLKFGDVVRFIQSGKYKYFIYVKEHEGLNMLTDGDRYFFLTTYKIERIGTLIDKNIVDLIPKGESL